MLLRIYFDGCWWAEYLVGCDVERIAITFAQAMILEGQL